MRATHGSRYVLVAALAGGLLSEVAWAEKVPCAPKGSETTAPGGPWGDPFKGRGLGFFGTFGYSTALSQIFGLDVDPFRVSAGLRGEYAFASGLSIGLYGEYFFGTSRKQMFEPLFVEGVYPILTESSLFSAGLDAAFTQPLGPVLLRERLGVGISALSWDFGGSNLGILAGYPESAGTDLSLHTEPSLAVLAPTQLVNTGIEGYCRLELSALVPTACGGRLLVGVRFR